MKKDINMVSGSLYRGILFFAIPVILTTLLQNLFHTADLIVVGQFCGSINLAAVTATSAITALLVSLFTGISLGTGLTVAKALGGQKDDEVFRCVHTALPTALICGGILSVFGILFSPALLRMMGTPEDILPLAAVYMRIYFGGMVFNMVYNFCSSILRAVGDTKSPLFFLIFSGTANVCLNLFFVIVCNMNVAGVAWATTISQAISAVLVVVALMRRTDSCHLDLKKIRIYKPELKSIIRIGLPAGIQSSLFSASNVIIASSINSFGSAAIISGHGAIQNVEAAIISPIVLGFSQAAPNFIAQNLGAHKFDRIKKTYFITMAYAFFTTLAASTIIAIFFKPIVSMYINDSPEAVKYAMVRLRYILMLTCVMSVMDISTSALRGLGKSFSAMVITLCGACGLRILWVYTIFQIPKCHTLACLYQSYPVTWTITAIIEGSVFLILLKKNVRKHENQLLHAQGGNI